MKNLHVIVDLQYGSTGKGLFAGYLARDIKPDTVVAAWGPNAGHTFIDEKGGKMVNIALPNGIISPNLKRVMLGPGSVINPTLLMSEMDRYGAYFGNAEIVIHENAAVVDERHREAEAAYGGRIGSTMKGVGEAVIEKIRRDPSGKIIARDALLGTPLEGHVVSADEYDSMLDHAECVLVEGAQGFSLSINQGFYPYVTSRDCTTHQILSDCAIPYGRFTSRQHTRVYGVCRTYPIRVNNRTGFSGPCYPDQEEIQWESIGLEPELTTVTRLPRRLFTFSAQQINQAIRMDGVDAMFLNFCNYLPDAESLRSIVRSVNGPVVWFGTGPKVDDVILGLPQAERRYKSTEEQDAA